MLKFFLYIILLYQISFEDQIKELNKEMEIAFTTGDLKKVASFYGDNSALISFGGRIRQGRKEVDEYWTRTANPVKWKLEVIKVSKNVKEIYDHSYYQSLKNKPPDWISAGFNFDNKEDLVYQLGHSTLTTLRNGTEHNGEVDFILVWEKTPKGYKILIDSYSWQ